MNKLVVLLCVALARSSLASVGHAYAVPAGTSVLSAAPEVSAIAGAPGVHLAAATPALRVAAAPAVAYAAPAAAPAVAYAAPGLAYAAPAPAVAYAAPAVAPAPAVAYAAPAPAVAYAGPAVAPAPAVAYAAPAARLATPAAIQTTSYAIQKNVHYASQPVVTGYSASVVKPNFGSLATPLNTVSQEPVLAAGRQVHTITPHVTRVEPEVSVQQVPVDVPVPTPVVSEVEVHTPVVQGPPVVAAAPAVAHAPVAVAPAPVAVAPAQVAVAEGPVAVAAAPSADLPTVVEARTVLGAAGVVPIGARIAHGYRLYHH